MKTERMNREMGRTNERDGGEKENGIEEESERDRDTHRERERAITLTSLWKSASISYTLHSGKGFKSATFCSVPDKVSICAALFIYFGRTRVFVYLVDCVYYEIRRPFESNGVRKSWRLRMIGQVGKCGDFVDFSSFLPFSRPLPGSVFLALSLLFF